MKSSVDREEAWFRDYCEDLRPVVCCVMEAMPCVQNDGRLTEVSPKAREDASDWIEGVGGISRNRFVDELFDEYCDRRSQAVESRTSALLLSERYVLGVEIDFAEYMLQEGLDTPEEEQYFRAELKKMQARLEAL